MTLCLNTYSVGVSNLYEASWSLLLLLMLLLLPLLQAPVSDAEAEATRVNYLSPVYKIDEEEHTKLIQEAAEVGPKQLCFLAQCMRVVHKHVSGVYGHIVHGQAARRKGGRMLEVSILQCWVAKFELMRMRACNCGVQANPEPHNSNCLWCRGTRLLTGLPHAAAAAAAAAAAVADRQGPEG